MAAIIFFAVAAVLCVLGILFRKGRGLMLLAGYNTMPAQQRDEIDKQALGRRAGNLMFRMAVCGVVIAACMLLGITWLLYIAFFWFIADPVITSIVMSRFVQTATLNKKTTIVVVAVTAAVFVLLCVMWVQGDADAAVSFKDGELVINSMYGVSIPADSITSITLDERSMNEIQPNAIRTNGYGGFGDVLKGEFRSRDLGEFMLFVRGDSAPTIRIDSTGFVPVFISMQNPNNTQALYGMLLQQSARGNPTAA